MARTSTQKMNDIETSEAAEAALQAVAAADYAENMFKDGHELSTPSKRSAKGYDEAVARDDAGAASEDNSTEMLIVTSADTMHSRDGTDAVGSDDEDGGALGGSEAELDKLEASGVPVDKLTHMKD